MSKHLNKLKKAIVDRGITVFDSFAYYGLTESWDGHRREQQVHCPGLHGKDNKRSARLYEDGGMHCWACQKNYDVFEFEKSYTGKTFSSVVYSLADRYNIHVEREVGEYEESEEEEENPVVSSISAAFSSGKNERTELKAKNIVEILTKRIIHNRRRLDLKTYQGFWVILDEVKWRIFKNQITNPEVEAIIDKLSSKLSKIISDREARSTHE